MAEKNMSGRLLVKGGAHYSNGHATDILINGRKIELVARSISVKGARVLDCRGKIVCPGFIDVHIQGAGGYDVLDSTKEALEKMSLAQAATGVASFLATTVYMQGRKNNHLRIAAELSGNKLPGAKLIGIHLEGPFISAKKRGMIQPDSICAYNARVMNGILKLCGGRLKMMTVAPEIKGGKSLVRGLVRKGVIASIGHTSADYDCAKRSIAAGISHVTHIFNAMPGLHHREPGPLGAIFEENSVSVQVITDGVHLHPAIVRMIYRLCAPERFVTITDGMQALGLPEGRYSYKGIEYYSKGGTARYKDGTLIGTATGLNELIKRLMKFTGCTLEYAVNTVTKNPAKALKIDKKKGYLRAGYDADVAVLNPDLSVAALVSMGRPVINNLRQQK